jgi:leucyl-tRNA synthetase
MLHGADGYVMSKSRGNVVLPEEVSKKYGIDTARLFLVSTASPDKDVEWSEKGIEGSFKFVNKIINYFNGFSPSKSSKRAESKINKGIKEITECLGDFKYNLAVIRLRDVFDVLSEERVSKKDIESFLKLLSVFCPHICEELWERIGNKPFISMEKWPVCNEGKIDEDLEKQDLIVSSSVSDVMNIIKIVREKEKREPKKVYLYVVPSEVPIYDKGKLERRIGKEVHIFASNYKEKHDPEGKAKKAKPGKPGIYVE